MTNTLETKSFRGKNSLSKEIQEKKNQLEILELKYTITAIKKTQ